MLVLPLLMFFLLLVPASAAATLTGPVMQFQLPAANGFTLQVNTEGQLTLVTLERGRPHLSSTYYVSDSAGDGTIDADLGALGHIDVRFEPSGETKAIEVRRFHGPRCRVLHQAGTFAGTISFRGEGGYTAVDAVSAWGTVGPSVRGLCDGLATRYRQEPEPIRRNVERVWAVEDASLENHSHFSTETESATYFAVLTEGSRARYLVNRVEVPTPQLSITRSIDVTGPRSSFSYRSDLRSATLRPPAPFSGEATYSARQGRLRGDLAVEMPGLPLQPLTGPGFEARIIARR
jgi:hypothetical protein